MGEYLLSVIIPVYREEENIEHNLRVIGSILERHDVDYEFVLVDDGSPDGTWNALRRAANEFKSVTLLRLSRNFGKESALCAGLAEAKGDACLVMDSDLQHPPELIPEMLRLWREQGFDVVEGVKKKRSRENPFYRIAAKLFYAIFQKLSGLDLEGASDFKLLDAKVVKAWKSMDERTTFFRGMSSWVGFRRVCLPFEVAQRAGGTSKWSLSKLVKLATNAVTAFSALPLNIVTVMGIVFLIGSVILGVQTLYKKIVGTSVTGFTTVILLLLIIGSALMLSLGIIGTYIAKIYDEVKFRPRYILSQTIRKGKDVQKGDN